MNFPLVRLYAAAAWLCVNEQRQRIGAAIMQQFSVNRASVSTVMSFEAFINSLLKFTSLNSLKVSRRFERDEGDAIPQNYQKASPLLT